MPNCTCCVSHHIKSYYHRLVDMSLIFFFSTQSSTILFQITTCLLCNICHFILTTKTYIFDKGRVVNKNLYNVIIMINFKCS